jgi:hypothetical protein
MLLKIFRKAEVPNFRQKILRTVTISSLFAQSISTHSVTNPPVV